jgi:hypothetical protein
MKINWLYLVFGIILIIAGAFTIEFGVGLILIPAGFLAAASGLGVKLKL